MFCPRCKSLINPKTKSCDCGYSPKKYEPGVIRDVIKEEKERDTIDGRNTLAVHNHFCKKCGHDKAEMIDKGIWYSDEDNIILFRCGKCGFTEMGEGKIT